MRRIAIGMASLAMVAGAAIATTAPAEAQQQDGLVNVNVGDVNILNDARIGVAANVVANICNLKVGPVAVLATQVDATGESVTVCTAEAGDVIIEQN